MGARDDNPAAVYRDSLSRGSYWAIHHSLETIVTLPGGDDPWTYPWHRLRYRDTARVRAQLCRALRAGNREQDPLGPARRAEDLLAAGPDGC